MSAYRLPTVSAVARIWTKSANDHLRGGITIGGLSASCPPGSGAIVETYDGSPFFISSITAGLTALRSLEVVGLVLDKRVLITGATGGVGRFAVQLAHASGARVTALVRDASATAESLRRLGAAEVVQRLDDDFDVIIDAVGGATLGLAIEHVAARGIVINIGTLSPDELVTFRAGRLDRAARAMIYTLNLPDELSAHASATTDLVRLCRLVGEGRLDGQIGLEKSWREHGAAIEALLDRTIAGKAVLHVD